MTGEAIAVGVGAALGCLIIGALIIYIQAQQIEKLADKELRHRRKADDRPGRPYVK